MKWIKYKILQSIVDELPIFIEKKIGHSQENLTIAQSEAYNKEYTVEEDSEVIDIITNNKVLFDLSNWNYTTKPGEGMGSFKAPNVDKYNLFAIELSEKAEDEDTKPCATAIGYKQLMQGNLGPYYVIRAIGTGSTITSFYQCQLDLSENSDYVSVNVANKVTNGEMTPLYVQKLIGIIY